MWAGLFGVARAVKYMHNAHHSALTKIYTLKKRVIRATAMPLNVSYKKERLLILRTTRSLIVVNDVLYSHKKLT